MNHPRSIIRSINSINAHKREQSFVGQHTTPDHEWLERARKNDGDEPFQRKAVERARKPRTDSGRFWFGSRFGDDDDDDGGFGESPMQLHDLENDFRYCFQLMKNARSERFTIAEIPHFSAVQ